jgi:PIN domain nuclease of toxin-antitoxin system
MRILLDSHLLVWTMSDSERLPAQARKLMDQDENELLFSVASIWKIAIQSELRRSDFCVDARRLRRNLLDYDYTELPVTGEHALAVCSLPPIHKDPFDRILVAQATAEGILLLTCDPVMGGYPGPVRLV